MAARPYMVAANPNGDETTVVLRESLPPIDWAVSDEPVGYEVAVAVMEKRAAQIAAGEATELIWLLEHPPLYTAGTSARQEDLLAPDRFPVFKAGRGGQYTYHGPGQRVAYVMLDVSGAFRRRAGIRRGSGALGDRGAGAVQREGRNAAWTRRRLGGAVRERARDRGQDRGNWNSRAALVSFHGVSINVDPDLSHFTGIVPCGISEHGVTSLADLGLPVTMPEVDMALREAFEEVFGPTRQAVDPMALGDPLR